MSALTIDLDDVDGLLAADRDGLLRAAAMAGAGVRSVSQAQAEGVLARLSDFRPRAVVFVTGSDSVAHRAADLVVATIAARIDVPLVSAPALPGWIGPLDVVVIAGGDAGDPALGDAAMRALRRRAELVVAVPIEGPLLDAIGDQQIIDLSPRLVVDARFGFCRFVAALTAVCLALTEVRLAPAPPDLADLADRLDDEASADHPSHESFHNQAKLLAMRTVDRSVVWAGDTPGAVTLASHASATVFGVAGVVTHPSSESGLVARLRDGAPHAAPVDDLFYDPDFDPPRATGIRGILFTTSGRNWHAERRMSGYSDVAVIAEQVTDADTLGEPAIGLGEPLTDAPADLAAYLVLALRTELAAVFIRLMGEAA
ncbi:hypothetical protein [Gordonia sp. (in: high G+C Gram-positive bacteria)]|uniref:hypothetical protein n=1 Tax=Gordonia sp. (in: high G+C Gram-positive bacteria) TaxID=84139 RepID=UPI0016AD1B97|nr:hypothetical protein [Gordonia sp. (in: high G+C Gram-positive bacteria)]NLG46127.1 hypothetical protein [Gordonia sp. (in: high G+C Gram-positive bacteria)]